MEQPIHDYVVSRLQASKGRLPQVAKETRVPLSTLRKVANRSTRAPRIDTLEAIASYYRQLESGQQLAT